MPTSLQIRREITGASPVELPDVKRFYANLLPESVASIDRFPFGTVTAEGTNGELSNQIDPETVGNLVEKFDFEYTILVVFHVLVESHAGEGAARLQVERLALAAREALLSVRTLVASDDGDEAEVKFDRWVEEYDADPPQDEGAWIASARLLVPVATREVLDRSPYLDETRAVLHSWDTGRLPFKDTIT